MSRPTLRPLLPATLLVLALAGCSVPGATTDAQARPGPDADLVPELDPDQEAAIVWESYNLGSAGIGADTVNELVRRFEEQHPNIDVTAQAPQGGVADI